MLNDPANFIDPLGLEVCSDENLNPALATDGSGGGQGCDIVVTGTRIPQALPPLLQGQPPGPGGPAKPKATPKPKQKPEICARFSSAVYVLNFVGNAADIAALGSIGAAAITSPAPPVAAGFATFAAVAKGVSLAAGVGVTAIHAINGNWGSAATSAGSTAIGQLGGRGLQALGRTEGKQVGDLTAAAAETGAGQAVNAGGC